MDFNEIVEKVREKLTSLTEEDIFPVMKKFPTDDVYGLCKAVGVYLAAVILMVVIIFALGWIPVLGIIMKIIAFAVIIYATIGTFAALLYFLKYN